MENEEVENEALDFELDKTYNTLFEAGKNKSNAFIKYLLLLATTSLLVFSQSTETEPAKGNFKIPFLDLTLDKNSAAFVLLLLSCVALYWYNISHIKQGLIREKLCDLFRRRYKKDLGVNWHITYPTPLWIPTSSIVRLPRLLAIFANIIFSFLSIVSYVLPLILSWQITTKFEWSFVTKILVGLLLITPALILQLTILFDAGWEDNKDKGYLQEHLFKKFSTKAVDKIQE